MVGDAIALAHSDGAKNALPNWQTWLSLIGEARPSRGEIDDRI